MKHDTTTKVISAEFVFKETAWDIWPYLSQIDLIESLGGTPAATVQFAPSDAGESRVLRTGWVANAKASFEELPWEWFPPDRIVGQRSFSEGVFRHMALVIDGWEAGGGWKIRVQLQYTPRSTSWLSQGKKAAELLLQQFMTALAKIEDSISSPAYPFDALAIRPFAADPAAELRQAARTARAWQERLPNSPVALKLAEFIFSAPARHVVRMRPLAIAEHLGLLPGDVVAACFEAATRDLLILHWDVPCPQCRRVTKRAGSLADIEGEEHCAACNVTFPVTLHRDVEVSFTPVSSLAPADLHAGEKAETGVPGLMPHCHAQFALEAASERTVILNLTPGRYHLRSPTVRNAMLLDVREQTAADELKVRVEAEFPFPELVIPGKTIFKFENPDSAAKWLKLERLDYRAPLLSAAEALSLPLFQRLFPRQVPGRGKAFHNGGRVFLFVDFKDSTAIYKGAGDLAAHLLFQEWHTAMRHIVAESGGVVVKTMADSAMVLLSTPRQALECARHLYAGLERWNRTREEHEPFVVKMGLHEGACVTYTADGRLDYAGAAVNTAVRYQRMAHGNDLVLAESVFNQQGPQEWHGRHADLVVSTFTAPGAGEERLCCIRYILPVGASLL